MPAPTVDTDQENQRRNRLLVAYRSCYSRLAHFRISRAVKRFGARVSGERTCLLLRQANIVTAEIDSQNIIDVDILCQFNERLDRCLCSRTACVCIVSSDAQRHGPVHVFAEMTNQRPINAISARSHRPHQRLRCTPIVAKSKKAGRDGGIGVVPIYRSSNYSDRKAGARLGDRTLRRDSIGRG